MFCANKISVIIPIYNTEKYLHRCLNSILNNTYTNLEVICVNDGSTDQSLSVLQEIASNDARVVVISQPNKGVSAARNVGLATASGEYVTFVDSDDWIHPRFFELLLTCLTCNNADIVACSFAVTEKESLSFPNYAYDELIINQMDISSAISSIFFKHVSGLIYKRNTLSGFRFSETLNFAEDSCFNVLVLISSTPTCFTVNTPLYYYYMRNTSLIHTANHHQIAYTGALYLEQCKTTSNVNAVQLFAFKAFTAALAGRYFAAFEGCSCSFSSMCQKILQESLTLMKGHVPTYKWTIFKLFCISPSAYRLYRIAGDPTLLRWERAQRNQ